MGDDATVLGPGRGLAVPPGVAHRLRNRRRGDLPFLVISAPTSRGDRITSV